MTKGKPRRKASPDDTIPPDAVWRRPRKAELKKAIREVFRRYGKALDALGDTSELSGPKKD